MFTAMPQKPSPAHSRAQSLRPRHANLPRFPAAKLAPYLQHRRRALQGLNRLYRAVAVALAEYSETLPAASRARTR